MSVKDLINETRIHVDRQPLLGSSDNTSDGTINVGIGVPMAGYRYATVIFTSGHGVGVGTSDVTARVRLQQATIANVASDCADTDYSNFTTDALGAALAYATSDSAFDGSEGVQILHVDLLANGMTGGCVRTQFVGNGTNVNSWASVIILSRRNGGPVASTVTATRF